MNERTAEVKSTTFLINELTKATDYKEYTQKNAGALGMPKLRDYLKKLCDELEMIPEQVIKKAGIERTYGHQLFNGRRKPSRDKVIQLAIGFGLGFEGCQDLLKIAHKNALYPKAERDSAIIFCLSHEKDIFETQSLLEGLGLTILGGE
jgi:hypothetical protein